MKKEILNQLKSDYEKLEIKPSADLWDKIELVEPKTEKTNDLGSKVSFQWWKYVAVLLLLISVGSLFYFNLNQPEKNSVIAKNNDSTELLPSKSNVENSNSNINYPENNFVASKHEENEVKLEEKIFITQPSLPSTINNNQILIKEENPIIVDSPNKVLVVLEEISQPEKPLIVERKKGNYIKADDLLLGREFDKTREENQDIKEKFGVLDVSKIRIKSPNSLKILGMTVFSDSLEAK